MKDLEEKIEILENKIDPPERDLLAKDVIGWLMNLVIVLVVSLLILASAFIGYAIYQDCHNNYPCAATEQISSIDKIT